MEIRKEEKIIKYVKDGSTLTQSNDEYTHLLVPRIIFEQIQAENEKLRDEIVKQRTEIDKYDIEIKKDYDYAAKAIAIFRERSNKEKKKEKDENGYKIIKTEETTINAFNSSNQKIVVWKSQISTIFPSETPFVIISKLLFEDEIFKNFLTETGIGLLANWNSQRPPTLTEYNNCHENCMFDISFSASLNGYWIATILHLKSIKFMEIPQDE